MAEKRRIGAPIRRPKTKSTIAHCSGDATFWRVPHERRAGSDAIGIATPANALSLVMAWPIPIDRQAGELVKRLTYRRKGFASKPDYEKWPQYTRNVRNGDENSRLTLSAEVGRVTRTRH